MRTIHHWIDGGPFEGLVARHGPVYDPSTGQQQAQVAFAEPGDVDRAVAAARSAFKEWRDTPVTVRQRIMFAFRDLIDRHRSRIAELVTAEHGKTLADAAGEVQRGIEVVEFACGIPHLLKGEVSTQVAAGVDTITTREPLGVMAGVTPLNFPAMVPMWMYPVAIACGNTFVLKPSEKDPSPSLFVAELLAEAGLPGGVFNVVQGDQGTVEAILRHPDIAAVSFVGSTAVAESIYRDAAATGKRVQALGGAKNHMVVLPDADLVAAADAAVSAAYGTAGERCMAISVVVAVGDVGDRLRPMLEERITALRVGSGTDEASDMGPLITATHRERVHQLIDSGEEEGAELAVDGRGLVVTGGEDGFYLGPTLFDHVTTTMQIYREEIFGPVLVVVRVDTLGEAIDLVNANANAYGNGTAVFTASGAAARAFGREIEVGMVGVNIPIPVPLSFHSFGGWKRSMFGAHGIYGPEGIRFATRQKVLISRWDGTGESGVDLRFPHAR